LEALRVADNFPHGLFSWADLGSPDPEGAAEFYSAVFGWDVDRQTDPDGNYIHTLFSVAGKVAAGLYQRRLPLGLQRNGSP